MKHPAEPVSDIKQTSIAGFDLETSHIKVIEHC
jgi:hypothetical protein